MDFAADFLNYDKENIDRPKRELDYFQMENFGDGQQLETVNHQTFSIPTATISNNNDSIIENANFSVGMTVVQSIENRMPLDLSGLGSLCKLEMTKNDIPYLIKHKLDGGKHVRVWQCRTCGKEFGHQYTLMRHLPTHTDERKFQCNTCGKAFRQMSTLSQHRAIHSHERPYICEICQKTFNRVSTLISHRKTHSGIKPHQCHMCNKAFHQKGNLRNHVFTHTNERPYKCDDCGKGFNQMSNLMCHKLKTHQRVDKPRHSCQVCGTTFSKRIALRNHEQYDHKLASTGSNYESSTCDQAMSNAIFVEPIKTKAMQLAVNSDQIPFALLRPSTGIPVLVKVLSSQENGKQMLVPASAEDLKKYGQISVTPKTNGGEDEDKKESVVGSTVQIKIPVVATVIQKSGEDGKMSVSVVSPGPSDQGVGQSNTNGDSISTYVFNTASDKVVKKDCIEDCNHSEETLREEQGQCDSVIVDQLVPDDVFSIQ